MKYKTEIFFNKSEYLKDIGVWDWIDMDKIINTWIDESEIRYSRFRIISMTNFYQMSLMDCAGANNKSDIGIIILFSYEKEKESK